MGLLQLRCRSDHPRQSRGRSELDSIAIMAQTPDLDFMMIVDSAAGIEAAAEAVRRNHLDSPLHCLSSVAIRAAASAAGPMTSPLPLLPSMTSVQG
jgi:hypothetical protein